MRARRFKSNRVVNWRCKADFFPYVQEFHKLGRYVGDTINPGVSFVNFPVFGKWLKLCILTGKIYPEKFLHDGEGQELSGNWTTSDRESEESHG